MRGAPVSRSNWLVGCFDIESMRSRFFKRSMRGLPQRMQWVKREKWNARLTLKPVRSRFVRKSHLEHRNASLYRIFCAADRCVRIR